MKLSRQEIRAASYEAMRLALRNKTEWVLDGVSQYTAGGQLIRCGVRCRDLMAVHFVGNTALVLPYPSTPHRETYVLRDLVVARMAVHNPQSPVFAIVEFAIEKFTDSEYMLWRVLQAAKARRIAVEALDSRCDVP